ncbi:MAG: ferredoxin family protein [Candidatus Omnitrophica bacterium]|nr:ferredoxin family protein [Candidatus Omnitrophota bacterium]
MGKIKINIERCKGCYLCVITCPKKLIEKTGPINGLGLNTVKFKDIDECSGCSLCAIMCPDCAIVVWR